MFPEVGKELKKPEDSHVASGVKVRTNNNRGVERLTNIWKNQDKTQLITSDKGVGGVTENSQSLQKHSPFVLL